MNPAQRVASDMEENSLIEVTTTKQFGVLLANWHTQRVQRMEQLLAIPEGMMVQLGDEKPFRISGAVRKGMKLGVELALMEFRDLPFVVETEPADAAQVETTAEPS